VKRVLRRRSARRRDQAGAPGSSSRCATITRRASRPIATDDRGVGQQQAPLRGRRLRPDQERQAAQVHPPERNITRLTAKNLHTGVAGSGQVYWLIARHASDRRPRGRADPSRFRPASISGRFGPGWISHSQGRSTIPHRAGRASGLSSYRKRAHCGRAPAAGRGRRVDP
jgi:hypothetical protein